MLGQFIDVSVDDSSLYIIIIAHMLTTFVPYSTLTIDFLPVGD